MSGAGMSRSGPSSSDISVVNRRVSRSSSVALSVLGIDDHAALGAAERQAHHGGLPGHEHGQRASVGEGHRGVIAQAALGGSAGDVVLDAEARVHPETAVVHLHREVHDQLALDVPQHRGQGGIEVELPGCGVEMVLGDGQRRAALHGRGHGHTLSLGDGVRGSFPGALRVTLRDVRRGHDAGLRAVAARGDSGVHAALNDVAPDDDSYVTNAVTR